MRAQELRTQNEQNLFSLAAIFSGMCWLALVVTLVGLLYLPFVALAILVGQALFLAHIRGNGVRVGSTQLPDLQRRIERASQQLGLPQVPEAYVIQAGGVLNAFATKFLSRRFVILYSELLDACAAATPPAVEGEPASERRDELDFVIAHEIAHHALGHLSWNWFLIPARLLPLLGPGYSRSCEYSCDACGNAVVNDLETSSRALALLAAGGHSARQVNLKAFADQQQESGGFFMAIYELNASHPYLSKRVAALRHARTPAEYPPVARNPLSYLFAPFLGFAGGGGAAMSLMVFVAIIGILAAIAIPSFIKFQERAKQSQLGLAQMPDPDAAPATAAPNAAAVDEEAAAAEAALAAARVARMAERFEARAWLKTNQNKYALASNRFGDVKNARAFVERLYKLGATRVEVSNVYSEPERIAEEGGPYADTLVVTLPTNKVVRKKLFALCSVESKKETGEPCVDNGEDTLTFWWD